MKILAIRIKNLASLDGITEIDFRSEPLSSAGIFAITGPTGAGKSTILDALCLALYAKTPRYRGAENGIDVKDVKDSTIKQDDVRGILRDGTAEGHAEVDFVGVDGQHYRATWRVRRARNKADGNLQGYEMALKNTGSNQDIPGRKSELLEEIERLVGLNFEQFTRSVLLAQGDFTAFLKAGRDEKSSLLERLTGTHIYSEISKRIFENHREQQLHLRELTIQQEGIPTLTSEELIALEAQKATLEEAQKSQEQEIDSLSKEITWHERWTTLKSGLKSAESGYEQASIDKSVAAPRDQQLLQIVRIQSVKPVVDNLQNTQMQLAGKSKRLEDVISGLTALHQKKEAVDRTIGNAQSDLNSKILEQENAQPLLNDAKALDVKLSEKAEQIKQVKDEVNTAVKQQNQHAGQLDKTLRELNLVEKAIADVNQWTADNETRRPIAEQEHLILSKLGDAETKLRRLQEYNGRIDIAELKKKSCLLEKVNLEREHITVQSSLNLAKKGFSDLQKTLAEIPIQNLEEEKSAVDHSVEDLIPAEAHWKILHNAALDLDDLKRSFENNSKDLLLEVEKLNVAGKSLEMKKSERDASFKMLEKAKLAAAENVERLRDQLEPEQPCPVCGSLSHPYASSNPRLDHVLAELEASHQQTDADYLKQLDTHSGLNQACIQLRRTIEIQEPEILKKEKSCQQLEETWLGFRVYDACAKQPVSERAYWLSQQLLAQKSRQQQLREQIQRYGKQKEKLEAYKTELAELEKKQNDIVNNVKDIERAHKTLQEQQENDSAEQQTANTELDELKQTLSVYLSSEQWFQNWQADAPAFTARIRIFAADWKNNIAKLEENVPRQSGLTASLKAMEEQAKNFRDDVKQKELKLSEAQAQWKDLSRDRQALFNGKSVQEVEKALKQAMDESRNALEKVEEEGEKLQTEITGNTAQKDQLERDNIDLQKQEASLRERVTEWLDIYNKQQQSTLTEAELLPLLEFTQDWIEAERASLRVVEDALKHASTVLTERSNALETHTTQRLSERTFEELTTLKDEVQTLLKQHTAATNEIGFKIREDEANKHSIGQLLHDIEKQSLVVENWAKLNDIIGSADGKKFRQIAQEYTLDVLLSYANVHLEVLSKRYVLQRIPNSLGLQVLDQDMGDEVRTVFSLSGGESFLVSLALALGLASLSSSRMTVESLFIDEGFGSLDPTTLNIAMDALERLHNQGRKVGVISHVQEMTERIPVQIKVSKQQSGKSRVEVVGF